MRIAEISSFGDFLALEEGWKDLLKRSSHTLFSTWEWLSTWWKYMGDDKRLILLLAEEDNRLVGIAPLMYSVDSMFGVRQGKIDFIGTDFVNNTTDEKRADFANYADFIIEPKHENCLRLFLDYLENIPEKWNCAELMNIPANQDSLSRLTQLSKEIVPSRRCLYVPLPKSKESLLHRIKYKDRKELRRYVKRINQSGFEIELIGCSKTKAVNDGMNDLFILNQKRWNARGLPGAFPDSRIRGLNMELANIFFKKGLLGLYCLKLSGKTVAVLYGFKYNGKYVAYATAFDPQYSNFNVGNLLFLNVMYECIQEGLSEFDFMWGTDSYKYQFRPSLRWTCEAIIPKKRVFGSFRCSLYEAYWRQGNTLKYLYEKHVERSY